MGSIDISTLNNGLLLLTFSGKVDSNSDMTSLKADIEKIGKAVQDLHSSQGKPVKVLINITDFTATYVSEGVDSLVELAKRDKDIVDKTAIFGGSLKLRLIGDTIVELSGRKNIKFFENKDGALQWLNS